MLAMLQPGHCWRRVASWTSGSSKGFPLLKLLFQLVLLVLRMLQLVLLILLSSVSVAATDAAYVA